MDWMISQKINSSPKIKMIKKNYRFIYFYRPPSGEERGSEGEPEYTENQRRALKNIEFVQTQLTDGEDIPGFLTECLKLIKGSTFLNNVTNQEALINYFASLDAQTLVVEIEIKIPSLVQDLTSKNPGIEIIKFKNQSKFYREIVEVYCRNFRVDGVLAD